MSSPQPPPDPQAAQAGLAVVLAGMVAALWPSLDLTDLRASLPAFKAAVAVQVQRHAQASATLAVRQYEARRVLEVPGGFRAHPADPPSVRQVAQTVDWATQPLWNANLLPETPAELPADLPSAGSAIADAKARLAAASERLVLDVGRDTIIENARRDPKARGWARVPEPGACAFCALLATRGAVYSEQSVTFRSHDNCRCHAEPVFTAYEPTAQIRQWQQQYAEATRGVRGMKAAQIAWRRAYEGRTAPTK